MSRPLTDSLDANVAHLKEMFGNSADLYAKPVNVRGVPCCLCFFEGLSTLERLWVVMLSMLNESHFEPANGQDLFNYIQHDLMRQFLQFFIHISHLRIVGDVDERLRIGHQPPVLLQIRQIAERFHRFERDDQISLP